MATGQFLKFYSKKCTAEVNISFINLAGSKVIVYLVPPPNTNLEKKILTKYLIKRFVDSIKTLVIESEWFKGFTKDLLIIINTSLNEYIKGKPMNITSQVKVVDGKLYLGLTMVFRHAGYLIDWGKYVIKNNTINVYTSVYEWTGPSAQVITSKKHTYVISSVTSRYYLVNVYVNGELFKTLKVLIKHENRIPSIIRYVIVSFLIILASIIVILTYLVKRSR